MPRSYQTVRTTLPGPACIAGAVLFSATAVAAEYVSTFEELDKDGNGYVSVTEATSRTDLEKNWKEIDKNSDDQLDITEFSTFEGQGRFEPPEDSEQEGIGAAPYK
jgi:hypothetical protein